jgi:hypothetical protein
VSRITIASEPSKTSLFIPVVENNRDSNEFLRMILDVVGQPATVADLSLASHLLE